MGVLCVCFFTVAIIIGIANIADSVPSTGRPNKAFCVDLTSGKVSYLPQSSTNVRWMKKPTLNAGRCRLQGVLKITPPTWSRFTSFHMAFESPYKYSFNLGDSWRNVAKGGDIPPGTTNDAEIWGYYSILRAKRNNKQGTTTLIYQPGKVRSAMLIRIYHRAMYLTNYAGYTYSKYDAGLFTYKNNNGISDNIYLGLNRVIHNFQGNPYWGRTGRGLCSVCVYFQP